MSRTVGMLSSGRSVDATRKLPTRTARPAFTRTDGLAARGWRRTTVVGRRGYRQLDNETRAAPWRVLHHCGPAMQLRELANNGESDPTALVCRAPLASKSYVGTPNTLAVFHRYSWAFVLHRDARTIVGLF